jgi:acetate---CoA ligase (ADP-forming)
MENINKPDMLLRHASSLINKGCRIAAIKSGSSDAGSRAASSHTGALATPDKAVESLFRKAGIVRCYGREDLIYTAGVLMQMELEGKEYSRNYPCRRSRRHAHRFSFQRRTFGSQNRRKTGKDLLDKLFPGSSVANPIDFLATGSAEQLGIIIDYVNDKFKEIDGMVVIFGSPGLGEIYDVYKVLDEKMKTTKKPIFPLLPSIVSARKRDRIFQISRQHIFFR